ncbi:MAG TPA: FaeA/PapI family transcriptional regulator [Thermoanaerobaculia bacterium]|nr:FaeA/PapI family transcriptional regulator [Thermoanaerobaculia bacterium]
MARAANVPPLTANQARYILEKLIDEGKVSAVDIRRHLAGMWQEMTFVEKRLSELRGIARPVKHPASRIRAAVKRAQRRRTVSPEVAASRQIQGQYLGLIRQVPEGDRRRFQDIARSKGREAAIAALKKRLGKS